MAASYCCKKIEPDQELRSSKPQVDMLESGASSILGFVSSKSPVNLSFSEFDWWVDSEANLHVCFVVLYVVDIRKNFISESSYPKGLQDHFGVEYKV